MVKSCRLCKHCYCADESDVSGLDCRINEVIKIVEPDKVHPCCKDGFKFSPLRFLFRTY